MLCNPTPIHALRKRCMHSEASARSDEVWYQIFCLCGVETSFLCNVKVYVGREFEQSERNENMGMTVALDLMKTIENSGLGVTSDNFFTSIPFADKLWEKKLTLAGLMRANGRAIPPQFQKKTNRALHNIEFGCQKEETIFFMSQS